MEISFSNLISGYLDGNGLFVPLTSAEVLAGKPDLPKFVTLVVRGDVRRGPYDAAGDGIADNNRDGKADDVNDATISQYLIPDQTQLAKNAHYYVRKAPALVGGIPTQMTNAAGELLPDPRVSVVTELNGEIASPTTIPRYWYMLIKPVGNTALLESGSFIEVGVNPRLPYIVMTLTGLNDFGVYDSPPIIQAPTGLAEL